MENFELFFLVCVCVCVTFVEWGRHEIFVICPPKKVDFRV